MWAKTEDHQQLVFLSPFKLNFYENTIIFLVKLFRVAEEQWYILDYAALWDRTV